MGDEKRPKSGQRRVRPASSSGRTATPRGAARTAGGRGTARQRASSQVRRPSRRKSADETAILEDVRDALLALVDGDFDVRLDEQAWDGLPAEVAEALNLVAERAAALEDELAHVETAVGREGHMDERASLGRVEGGWARCIDSVNGLVGDLVVPAAEIARVLDAVAHGDLSRKMPLTIDGHPVKGEYLRIGTTVNSMVEQLSSFAAEVTRVAREVGSDGKLGGQASVPGVSGTWKDLTDNVNGLAANLTAQVRNIAEVTTAVARGDLSRKITVDARGEVAELKATVNTMVDQLRAFAAEVTRVAREVGTDGRLGGQADVQGVSGVWKDLTDNVNLLAANLTDQVRNIAKVTTAVANGDLSGKITVEAKGEILALKDTINTMVGQLRAFASEVTRVAREVGTDGKLGGQAQVPGVSGTWKDLTDNVNWMASNLTAQVRNIAAVTTAVARGDLSRKITVDVKGEMLELKDTVNTMVDQLNSFASEVSRVAREVGTEGKLGGQAYVPGVSGVWKDLTYNVNSMASNLTTQVRGIVKVVTAVANGDLSQKLTVPAEGEVAALGDTINAMTETLALFAEQVSSVAREVGAEGKLGGQARVPGVSGTWRELTENVNFMASNLTTQVRGIVRVVTAVANGDLTQRLVLDAQGEVAALAETINAMTETLATFAEQVSTVAREVGIEGKLGGQAKVPGASGTWRDLTDNVNQLAANLTSQVRAIGDVATSVAKGDLTRSIAVEAQGEVAALKDNVNQMIVNLIETTRKNNEQDWLKTNLARFSRMMQGQKNLEAVSRLIMSELTPLVSAHHGAFFLLDAEGEEPRLTLTSSYAWRERKNVANSFRLGEGIVGQCALEGQTLLLTDVPPDYIQISSGLGEASPLNIIVVPVMFEGRVKAVIELASFHPFSAIHQIFLDQLSETIGVVLNMIIANMRTEQLLLQSQGLTLELQTQSFELTEQKEELKRSNAELEKQALELEEKARLLAEQNQQVEEKNHEVERARNSLEEKAEQLALISRYKSEFLANMSHELRTPLNSLLILARLLGENKEANLSSKQIEWARTIHAAGEDLLSLINEILDLAKVESGKMRVDPRDYPLQDLRGFVERTFLPVAEQKGIGIEVRMEEGLPEAIFTDAQRLQQVLKNLLANAFKFTTEGKVELHVALADGAALQAQTLLLSERVVAISVRDTGIGIPASKQQLIFEAFQQADGTTSRKYGGTGLGLSISRELVRLLGGEIHVESTVGEGSVFTVYLPERYQGALENLEEVVASTRNESADPVKEDCVRLEGARILLIDDDARNVYAMASVLEGCGAEVLYAEDGKGGLARIEEDPTIDLVITDVMMPEVDGFETMRRIRSNPLHASLPILAVTAKALEEDRERCLEAGASDYLAKPVQIPELLETIRLWLRR